MTGSPSSGPWLSSAFKVQLALLLSLESVVALGCWVEASFRSSMTLSQMEASRRDSGKTETEQI